MIAPPEPLPASASRRNPAAPARRPLSAANVLIRLIVGVIGLLFLAGGFAGYNAARGGAPMDRADWVVAGVGALLLAGLLWLMIDGWRRRERGDGPMPPRERFSNLVLAGSAGIGLLFAVAVQFAPPSAISADAPLPLWGAALGLIGLLVVAPAITIWWLRGIDELERGAYVAGGNVAAHVMLFGIPAAWLASRTGLIDFRPDIVLGLATVAWTMVWLRSKTG